MRRSVEPSVIRTVLRSDPRIATAVFSNPDLDHLKQLWAFIVFPLVGAVLGVIAWLIIDDSTLESTRLDSEATRAARDAVDKAVDTLD